MPLDPQIAGVLSLMTDAPRLSTGTPETARAGFRLFAVDLRDPATKADVRSVEDVTVPGPAGDRPGRVYRPDIEGPVPTVLFVHGGGFVIGDLDTHDDHARLICAEAGVVVLSLDYRLAPEHPFPAGYLDTVAALEHVFATADALGGDATRIGVAGDSAGGNLVAAAAIAARDLDLPLKAQLLLYPVTDFVEGDTHGSRVDNAEGYFLSSDDMEWFGQHYRGDADVDPHDPRGSVLHHPDLTGLAPAIVATAEYDPLRDEGEAYADALEKAGVRVVRRRFDGLIHGFFGMTHVAAAADTAARTLCADLKAALA